MWNPKKKSTLNKSSSVLSNIIFKKKGSFLNDLSIYPTKNSFRLAEVSQNVAIGCASTAHESLTFVDNETGETEVVENAVVENCSCQTFKFCWIFNILFKKFSYRKSLLVLNCNNLFIFQIRRCRKIIHNNYNIFTLLLTNYLKM